MRKALLVIALIGASFAGGAVVNGPGLTWARKLVLGQGGAGFVAIRGDDLVKSDSGSGSGSARPEPVSEVPSTPLPPLNDIPASLNQPADVPKPPVDAPSPPPEVVAEAPIASKSEPVAQPSPTPTSTPPPLSPPVALGRSDPAVSNVSLAREAPPTVEPAPAPMTPGSEPSTSIPTWSDLRRRMKELGVSRYWVEGEPGGPARFRCVIPVAGARAVAQHFEAEGDDDIQAADAALRRVALWRATEP